MSQNKFELFQHIAIIVVLVAFIITVAGVLALPVVMSVAYSCWWMFMYIAYLFGALIIACGFNSSNKRRNISNENHSAHR